MAKGISISMAADTRTFITGVQKGVIEPLDDAAEILEDLGRGGSRDLDRLEDSMRDAQRETDDTRKAFSDLQREIRETGRKSRTDFARPVKDSTREVNRDLEEVGNEAKQNAAEMFSSFDGSFESIADAAQGTLGGLTAGLGSIPAVAAVAAGAAGLGLVTTQIFEQQDLAEELKESLADAYKSAAAEGRAFIDQATIDAAVLEILFDSKRREAAMADAAKIGVDTDTYVRALAGDSEALDVALRTAQQTSADLVEELDYARGGESWSPAVQAVDLVKDRLEDLKEQHAENQEAASQYSDIVSAMSKEEREQIQRTRDADQRRWEEAARNYDQAADRGPIEVPIEPRYPTKDEINTRLQRIAAQTQLRIPAAAFTRDGTRVW